MQLIYTDETGINYKTNNEMYLDGPFIIYGGMCVEDSKYFHLERTFLDIIADFFSIDNWENQEIHATNIWNRKGYFKEFDEEVIRNFFDEVLQLLCKLDIKIAIGVYPKTLEANKTLQDIEQSKAISSFFQIVDHELSRNNDTGIIVADTNNSKNILGENRFTKIFFETVKWRTNPKSNCELTIKPKFKYESRAYFLLDNIHYVDSKNSLFNQITDIVLYVIMRVFTFEYLRVYMPNKAEIKKIPVSITTFNYFAGRAMRLAAYEDDDISFTEMRETMSGADDSIFYESFIRMLSRKR